MRLSKIEKKKGKCYAGNKQFTKGTIAQLPISIKDLCL